MSEKKHTKRNIVIIVEHYSSDGRHEFHKVFSNRKKTFHYLCPTKEHRMSMVLKHRGNEVRKMHSYKSFCDSMALARTCTVVVNSFKRSSYWLIRLEYPE